jgi:hypothetical protein
MCKFSFWEVSWGELLQLFSVNFSYHLEEIEMEAHITLQLISQSWRRICSETRVHRYFSDESTRRKLATVKQTQLPRI